MDDRSPTRRDVLRAGAALLATGTAGCEALLSDDTPTRTGQSTTTQPMTGGTVEPTPTGTDPTPSGTAAPTGSPTDTPVAPSVLTELPREDGASQDLFGYSTAIGSDAAFVGAPGAGSVFVFGRSESGWTRTATLTAGNDSGDTLGVSLAVANDRLLVGATPSDPDSGASSSAHVFERTDGEWRWETRLTPENGSAIDQFGLSVALAGGGALIGAAGAIPPGPDVDRTGAVYVFERTDGEWRQTAKLVPGDVNEYVAFGASLATAAGTLLAGAPGPATAGDGTGSVYAFERTEGEWRRAAKLVPGTGGPGASFGTDVAIADGTALIGAPGEERDDGVASGVTYVAERSDDGWQATAGLSPDDPNAGNRFGSTVELTGDTALVGAFLGGIGSVYVLDRTNGAWSRRTELVPDPPPVNGGFGSAIATTGETALIGAPYLFGEAEVGAAYVADLTAL
jgi:hypothetical protein